MKVMITGRHLELSDDVKMYAEKKMHKAETYFDHIIEAHIVLSAEKHRRIAEVTLNARNVTIHATEETEDLYSSIDGVMEKVEAQVKKYKEKLNDRKYRNRDMMPEAEVESSDVEEESKLAPQIVKVRRFAPKPMTPQEAMMQISLLEDAFLMFSNSQTDQVNVVYKRKDGSYGWIEPDFE